ncbi:MAG: BlaI/MecI/CopY family transcriptional regulator, partial [Thermoprotei archaeon]|nr:BlaI/MecI/CopY family transcriptional regulator [Thermoprotei archaeon]
MEGMIAMGELNRYRRTLEELEPIVEGLKRLIMLLGFPDSCAYALAVMYVIREPLIIDNLSQLTGYARTTLFTCMNILERLGLVSKKRVGRKYAYVLASKPSKVILSRFREVLERGVRPLIKTLERLIGSGLKEEEEVKVREILEDLIGIKEVLTKVVSEGG